jgi:hypothetical protein
MTTAPNFPPDREAFLAHHAAIYGSRTWPEGTLLGLMTQPGSPVKSERGQLRTLGFVNIGDAEAAWAKLKPVAERGHNTWLSVGGLDSDLATRSGGGRGKKSDVVGLPALVADLDWQSAGALHAAGDKNPTTNEVTAWVDSMPLMPTLAVHSGGGAHVWLRTSFLIDPLNNGEHDDILARWKAWWVNLAESSGRSIDKSVLADVARILRPAGTWNANQGKPVRITRINDAEYSLAELQAVFPPLPVREKRTKRPTPAVRVSSNISSSETPDRAVKIGDRFAWAIPATEFAEQIWGVQRTAGDGLIFPRGDGSFASDANARVFPSGTEPEKLTIFGERVLNEFRIDGPHSWTSWELLALHCLDGDFFAAAKLLGKTEVDGSWGAALFAAARLVRDSGIPPLQDNTMMLEPLRDSSGQGMNIRTAIEAGSDFVEELEGGLLVKYGRGSTHGLFIKMKEEVDGKSREYHRRVTSWIAWKSTMTTHLSVASSGEPFETDLASYTLQVLDGHGRRMSREGFSAEDAHKPSAVLDRIDIGAVLPDLSGRRAVEAMLRATGRHDAMVLLQEFHRLGWMHDIDTGSHVFLAPAGSVTAEGPTHAFTVGSPAGSQAGAGTTAAMAIGYPDIPQSDEGIRDAAKAIQAFYAVLPKRPDVVSAILGAVFASPLALSRRCTVFITAAVGVGKTNVAACGQAFINGDTSAKSFTGGPIANDSVVAAGVKTDWARNTVSFWDDYAMGSDPKVNDRVNQITSEIIKLSYGQDGASGGTADGGLRASRKADSIAVITGEATPAGAGIASRLVHIMLEADDVALTPMGTSPYDVFMSEFASSARQLHGAYIQWLAARVDECGLQAFTRANNDAKKLWGKDGAGRTSETVAVLGVGMTMFREFAQVRGFEDLLPTAGVVDESLMNLIAGNEVAVADSNPASVLISRVRDLVAAKGGYVDSRSPAKLTSGLRRRLGWVERMGIDSEGNRATNFEPGNFRVGYISDDRRHVVILNEALTKTAKLNGLGGVPQGQLKLAAAGLVVAGTVPGEKASRQYFSGRPRGWVVDASMLDLDNLDDGSGLTPELNSSVADVASHGAIGAADTTPTITEFPF